MANAAQASCFPTPGKFTAPFVLGASAAVTAALFVLFHWTVALVGALVALGLAATANEQFLLVVLFLSPVSWVLGNASSIIEGLPSYSGIDVMQAVRWLTICGFFLGAFWRGELRMARLTRAPFARASFAFAAAVLLSSVLGPPGLRFSSLARAGTHLIVFLGFFFLILAWAVSRERLERIVRVLLFSVIVTSCLGIVQMLIGGYTPLHHFLYAGSPGAPPWSGRASSFFATVDQLAVFNCLFLPLALGCYALAGGRWKRIGGWTLVLGTVALICTQSKGGLLALAAIMLTGVLYLMRTWKARAIAFIVISFFGAAVYAIVHFASLTHASHLQESSFVGRFLLWSVGWKFFISSPIHGIGWENFQILHTYELDAQMVAAVGSGVESLYFQLLSETGILGFTTFLLLLFLAYKTARKSFYACDDALGRALSFGVLGAVVVMLVQGITEAQLEVPQLGAIFWMLIALFVVSGRLGPRGRPQLWLRPELGPTERPQGPSVSGLPEEA